MRFISRLALVATLLTIVAGLSAQNNAQAQTFTSSARIDWRRGVLEIDITGTTRGLGQNPASAATTVTRNIYNSVSQFVLEALLKIRVDSYRKVSDLVRQDPSLLRRLEALSAEAKALPSRIGTDLASVTVPFTLELFPSLTRLLVHHRSPAPIEQKFQWQGAREYTGIVIFAGEELAHHGEQLRGQQIYETLKPSLFMELFNPDLYPVAEPNRTDPEFLVRWGSAAYTSDFDESPFAERIGRNPLRVLASELFGSEPVDIILNEDIFNVLLFSESNRRILQEARILIIIPEQNLVEPL